MKPPKFLEVLYNDGENSGNYSNTRNHTNSLISKSCKVKWEELTWGMRLVNHINITSNLQQLVFTKYFNSITHVET